MIPEPSFYRLEFGADVETNQQSFYGNGVATMLFAWHKTQTRQISSWSSL